MKSDHRFRAAGALDSVREGIRLFLAGEGWRESPASESALVFRRGSRSGILWSFRTESWPAVLGVSLVPLGAEATGIALHYEIGTGGRLVGALDLAAVEVEVACLEDYLRTGLRRSVAEEVAVLRRPVRNAVLLNMAVVSALVSFVGLIAGFPAVWVALAAALVATLDAIVIFAFADLVYEGTGRLFIRLPGFRRTGQSP